jgi:hypothetical protein
LEAERDRIRSEEGRKEQLKEKKRKNGKDKKSKGKKETWWQTEERTEKERATEIPLSLCCRNN